MKIRLLAVLCLVAATLVPAHSSDQHTPSANSAAMAKIASWVLERTQDEKLAEFLVVLEDQADLSGAASLNTKKKKGHFVYNALWSKARDTQQSLLSLLESGKIEHRSYYIVNMIWVKGDLNVALSLAARPEVGRLEGNPLILNNIGQPSDELQQQSTGATETIENNITNTRAPEVWGLGFTGQGVVVAGADTGYRWDHATLKPHYRGFDGVSASHDFNWHDSVHSGGGNCGANSPQPCDDGGHGTHTMGTVVGDDGAGNQIGMAPGSRWIGCRNMNLGNGTPASYIECMEFFLAPYPVNGNPAQGDPDKAPHITTNSWTCPPSEGCAPGTLQQAVDAQRAAGIMMVVAAGNSGPSCSTVIDPPAIYDAAYSVGAVDHRNNTIANFSSRGPVTIDGSNRLKPDITGPGVSIRSAWNSGTAAFNTISGTSMATPHVAGAVALLWSAQPALLGNVLFAEQILNNTAVHVTSTSCSSNGVPNNTYGYGRLDIKSAVDAALPCTSAPTLSESSASFSAIGGTGSVNVTSVMGCGWIAESNASWIMITSESSGTGNGQVIYSVAVNTNSGIRRGTMTIAGKSFTVVQRGTFGGNLFDFDGDAKTDLAIWRPADGNWWILNSSGGYRIQQWGYPDDMVVPGDYDGDGKTDIAIYRPANGNWWILESSNGTVIVQQWGYPSDIPVPADYDGDGRTDIAVWRPADGNWWILNRSNGTYRVQQWGYPSDIPLPADYDGDGKTDIAIWRPGDGNWWILNSTGGYRVQQWGYSSDIPVPGDYDGDGKTDIAIQRPADGYWWILNSSGGYRIQQWGYPGDRLAPGDYDGDGKTDIAIWRPGDGYWWILNSTGGYRIQQWGYSSDIPAPSAYVRQ